MSTKAPADPCGDDLLDMLKYLDLISTWDAVATTTAGEDDKDSAAGFPIYYVHNLANGEASAPTCSTIVSPTI